MTDCLECHRLGLEVRLRDREIELLKELNKRLERMYDEAIVLTKKAQSTADRALDMAERAGGIKGQAVS